MNKKLLFVIFAIPFVCLSFWALFLTQQINTGKEVRVRIMGYDPRDLLSGHYIQYQIDWAQTDCSQFSYNRCPNDEFCNETLWGRKQCRFYVPEKHAEELDRLFRRRNQTDMIFEVVYSYKENFEPIAKQLLINGQSWQESLGK